jgi:hypothetical protein
MFSILCGAEDQNSPLLLLLFAYIQLKMDSPVAPDQTAYVSVCWHANFML